MKAEGVVGVPPMADKISSLGLVAISSSRGVICMVLAGGTAFKIVPLTLILLSAGRLFLLIHLPGFSLDRLGMPIAACAIKDGFGSGESAPRRLKMEMLRLAMLLGLHCISFVCPWSGAPLCEGERASGPMMLVGMRYHQLATVECCVRERER